MTKPRIAVGFDVGGTNVRGVPVRADGSVGSTVKVPRPDAPDDLVAAIVDITEEIVDAEALDPVFVGVGCAGIVDRAGVVRTSPNIPTLIRFPLQAELARRIDVPVEVDNDATTATWAETRLGAAVGYDDVAFVALGTGIGTGFVFDGRLHRGASGFAGESGHMIIDHGGIGCVCGRSGCWERYASGTAYGRLAREAVAAGKAETVLERAGGNAEHVRSEHVTELVAEGHPEAVAILNELAYWVAVGIGNLVSIVDPAIVVVGGGVADMGEVLVEAIRDQYEQVMIGIELRDPLPIVLSRFGGGSGAIGAALLHQDTR